MITDASRTEFESKLRDSLAQGAGHELLLGIVRRFKVDGGTQREAYDTLQRIWLEYGFDEDDGELPNQIRDDLEYAMEVTWGFCSSAQRIWESSLSNG